MLGGIAQHYLAGRNTRLVSVDGDGTPAALDRPDVPMTAEFARIAAVYTAVLDDRRVRLAGLGEWYTAVRTGIEVVRVAEAGDTAQAWVTERTELDYARVHGDEPPLTAYTVDHVLGFRREYGAWRLGDYALAEPQSLPPVTSPWLVTGDGLQCPCVDAGAPADVSAYRSEEDCGVEGGCGAEDGVEAPAKSPTAATDGSFLPDVRKDVGTLDYTAMDAYVRRHWDGGNPEFRTWRNDSTNFASQALRAGGWADDTGYRGSAGNWWYNAASQTSSWTEAERWARFATRRTVWLDNVWKLERADVLQADFDGNDVVDHTLLVTAVTARTVRLTYQAPDPAVPASPAEITAREVYLTYRSADTLDRSLTSILISYPWARYRAYRT